MILPSLANQVRTAGAARQMALTGTPNQIELAEQIRPLVEAEFVRVAKALEGTRDTPRKRTVLAILEDKRTAVMANESAGYFISTWRELNDQVRLLIAADPRYPRKRECATQDS